MQSTPNLCSLVEKRVDDPPPRKETLSLALSMSRASCMGCGTRSWGIRVAVEVGPAFLQFQGKGKLAVLSRFSPFIDAKAFCWS